MNYLLRKDHGAELNNGSPAYSYHLIIANPKKSRITIDLNEEEFNQLFDLNPVPCEELERPNKDFWSINLNQF
jgi:hypothetical protein